MPPLDQAQSFQPKPKKNIVKFVQPNIYNQIRNHLRQGVSYSDDFSLTATTKFCTLNGCSKYIWLNIIKKPHIECFPTMYNIMGLKIMQLSLKNSFLKKKNVIF